MHLNHIVRDAGAEEGWQGAFVIITVAQVNNAFNSRLGLAWLLLPSSDVHCDSLSVFSVFCVSVPLSRSVSLFLSV